ncbi:MAG: hypothetical protein ACRD82_18895, partial [Blastocatellia bacterium]
LNHPPTAVGGIRELNFLRALSRLPLKDEAVSDVAYGRYDRGPAAASTHNSHKHRRNVMSKVFQFSSLIALAVIICLTATPVAGQKGNDGAWTKEFVVEKSELSATGRNPYFILEPGYQMVYERGKVRLVITVLDETKLVDGVETRVVEEYGTKAGKLVEISRNYFAISQGANNVFYFGEDVDIYKNGKVVSHKSAWLARVKGAMFGLMMPGKVRLKERYYQEIAPGVAMDRVEVVSLSEVVKTPAGEFKDCVKLEETTPLEPGVKDYKYFAAGIGMVQDGVLKLVKYGKIEKTAK